MKRITLAKTRIRARHLLARVICTGLCLLVLQAGPVWATGEVMGSYTGIPPFLTNDVKPNIVLALDISGSMKTCAYRDTSLGNWRSPNVHHDYNAAVNYYGYFNSAGKYAYDSVNGFFKEDASGGWSGNFLNWLCMRRIDVARKVLVGGWVRDRSGESIGGDTWYVIKGNHEPADYTFTKRYEHSASEGLTPAEYPDDTEFLISEGQIIPTMGGGATATRITDSGGTGGIEMGVVTMDWAAGDAWREVQFKNAYTHPVVVANSVSFNGNDPCGTRIKDVGDPGIGPHGGFRIRLYEWEYQDGDHTTEDIMYMVAEAGHHTVALDGGGAIEFDAKKILGVTACGTNNFLTVNYNIPFASPPVVFTGVGTYNGSDMTVTRDKDVTASNFKVVLQESELNGSKNCAHANAEEIHCIAVSQNAGVVSSTSAVIEAGTWDQVDNNGWRKIQYATTFPDEALVVTGMQTTAENDTANLRYKKAIEDSVMVRVREEQSKDNETNHAKENVGYVAVSGGGGAFNIQVGVHAEPTGIIQGLSSKVRFGLAVYNYDHSKGPSSIYTGNAVNGGTFNPCYPDVAKDVEDRTNYDICLDTHPKADLDNIIRVIETYPTIWGTTPMAETLYEIYAYFAQINHTASRGHVQFYNNGTDGANHCFGADNKYTEGDCTAAGGVWTTTDSYRVSNEWDPYYYDEAGGTAPCAMSFVLHFSDGAPYQDWDADETHPTVLGPGGDYDDDGHGGPQEVLDDMALYLRKNDIRTALAGYQEIISYYVFAALGEGELNNSDTRKMREAAVNGGFVDGDDDHVPDPAHPSNFISYMDAGICTENEWDSEPDCNPDTFYLAYDGYQLVEKLTAAIMDILRRAASGTAASVISNSRAGEGAIYQAVFFPNQIDGTGNEVDWVGDVHALWIDKYGNIREDCGDAGSCEEPCSSSCPQDHILDLETDYIVEFYTDDSGAARAKRFADTGGTGQYDSGSPLETNIPLQDVRYLWNAGEWLAKASDVQKTSYSDATSNRYIFTWFNGATDDSVELTPPALAAAKANYFRYFNAADTTEANKIINYVRGLDQSGCRSRQIDWDDDGAVETYKLGDIIHSTPTIVSRPAEEYDLIYSDPSYQAFRKKYEYRRTMIYAGGNDGGLHAFNGGYYDRSNKEFLKAPMTPAGLAEYDLGSEMWMFIPYNLLPHLKWLTDPDYRGSNHVYYVDLKPKVFDAKIFNPNDGIHAGGWGTVLVGGMRFGGGEIGVDLDGDLIDETTMRSAYFVLDITNPECPPVILGEFTDPGLGFTTCYPTAIPMATCNFRGMAPSMPECSDPDDPSMDWYLAFGSGPHPAEQSAMDGISDQLAGLYVIKLGSTVDNIYETVPETTPLGSCPTLFSYHRPSGVVAGYPQYIEAAFTNSFFSDVVAVDYDLSYQPEAVYMGSVYNTNAALLNDHSGAIHRLVINDDPDPAHWTLDTFMNVSRPVTAPPAMAFDGSDYWVYFGTGRFLTTDDKMTTAQQGYYGIKEPLDPDGNFTWAAYTTPDLMDVTGVEVTEATGDLSTAVGSASTFGQLRSSEIDLHDGWKFDFDLPGERNIGQASILGDIVAFTTYVPSSDYCTTEGDSYLYAVYYQTGTAYYQNVIGVQEATDYVYKKSGMGRGLATSPNIHTGVEDSSKAFVQTSTGAVIRMEQDNPGVFKSGPSSWREIHGGSLGE